MQRTSEGENEEEVAVTQSRWNHFIQTLPARLKRYKTFFGLVALLAINVSFNLVIVCL